MGGIIGPRSVPVGCTPEGLEIHELKQDIARAKYQRDKLTALVKEQSAEIQRLRAERDQWIDCAKELNKCLTPIK